MLIRQSNLPANILQQLHWQTTPADLQPLVSDIIYQLEAGTIQLKDLIQPADKPYWDSAALVISQLPLHLLRADMPALFGTLMDLNWPGSRTIFEFLGQLDRQEIEAAFKQAVQQAFQDKDIDWAYYLLQFIEQQQLQAFFPQEYLSLKRYLPAYDLP